LNGGNQEQSFLVDQILYICRRAECLYRRGRREQLVAGKPEGQVVHFSRSKKNKAHTFIYLRNFHLDSNQTALAIVQINPRCLYLLLGIDKCRWVQCEVNNGCLSQPIIDQLGASRLRIERLIPPLGLDENLPRPCGPLCTPTVDLFSRRRIFYESRSTSEVLNYKRGAYWTIAILKSFESSTTITMSEAAEQPTPMPPGRLVSHFGSRGR